VTSGRDSPSKYPGGVGFKNHTGPIAKCRASFPPEYKEKEGGMGGEGRRGIHSERGEEPAVSLLWGVSRPDGATERTNIAPTRKRGNQEGDRAGKREAQESSERRRNQPVEASLLGKSERRKKAPAITSCFFFSQKQEAPGKDVCPSVTRRKDGSVALRLRKKGSTTLRIPRISFSPIRETKKF